MSLLDGIHAYVMAKDAAWRERFGVSSLFARSVDLAVLVVGAAMILTMSLPFQALGVLLVMGGVFGFLFGGGEA